MFLSHCSEYEGAIVVITPEAQRIKVNLINLVNFSHPMQVMNPCSEQCSQQPRVDS